MLCDFRCSLDYLYGKIINYMQVGKFDSYCFIVMSFDTLLELGHSSVVESEKN